MKTAIVTDTNSSMSVKEGRERGIFVLSMPVIIDGKMYREGEDITNDEVFRAMAEQRQVSTSQPSLGEVIDLWEEVFAQGYHEIVHIPMSSALSSSYNSAKALAADYQGRIQVANNYRISLTLYEAVLDAKFMADQGKGAIEIRRALEEQADHATIYLTVETLQYLKRSGRVTAAAAALADFLNIKPVLTIQGDRLDAFAKVRGILTAERKMLEATKRDLQRFKDRPSKSVMVGSVGTLLNREAVDNWSKKIMDTFPEHPYLYHPLPTSIACHTGPNAFATGFVVLEHEFEK